MKNLITSILLICLGLICSAQDFQCQISINSSKVVGAGSNRNRYNALQQELYSFINDRKWCQYNLKTNERIECALMITLDAVEGDVYTGDMTVQLQRPIYGTSYKSTVLNFQDKNIQFTYEEGSPLEYSEGANVSQFTSLIAYYLNLFLAIDFDTFSMNGGAPYYLQCQSIVNFNQTSKEPGWKVYESGQNNRYWIIENMTNSTYSKLHEFLYKYHRLGLDVMAESPDAGRAVIAESLRLLQDVYKQKSNIYMVQNLLHAKTDEIINIFKQGTSSEKTTVLNILKQIDASNQSKYNAINAAN